MMPTATEREQVRVEKYLARREGKSLIAKRNENSLTHLLKNKDLTLEDKYNLVTERNPLLHILMERRYGQANLRNG